MPFADVEDLKLYFERAGAGEPLLYISGTGGDLRLKPNVFDGQLPERFEVMAYDQRGLGQSSKPDRPYSMADYADDAAALMDQAGWASAHVIGVSFGGMVAQELALRHPERVRRLALVVTSPGGAGGASFPLHELNDLDPKDRAARMIGLIDTRQDEAWARAHPELYNATLAMMTADPFAEEPGRQVGAWRQLEARIGHDAWDRLDQIAAPTLIAAGRYDGIALPASQENMAGRVPDARLRFFEGGHMILMQDPAALGAIATFLAGEDAD